MTLEVRTQRVLLPLSVRELGGECPSGVRERAHRLASRENEGCCGQALAGSKGHPPHPPATQQELGSMHGCMALSGLEFRALPLRLKVVGEICGEQ